LFVLAIHRSKLNRHRIFFPAGVAWKVLNPAASAGETIDPYVIYRLGSGGTRKAKHEPDGNDVDVRCSVVRAGALHGLRNSLNGSAGRRWRRPLREEMEMTLGTLLLVVVILLLIGAIPSWPHSRNWGYGPSGVLGVVVVIVVLLVVMGRI
jgi:uncharacterized protein DUF3309